MRVLHVAPSIEQSYGGPTRSLAAYLAASVHAGIDAHVAAPNATADDVGYLERSGSGSVLTFESSGQGGLARSPSLVRWVAKNAASYEVVHVHGLFNFVSSLSSKAAISAGVPLVIRPFGTLSRYTFTHRRAMLKRGWFNVLERPNLLGASAIHFTTSTERDRAAWHNLPLAGKAHVVPPPYLHSTKPESASPGVARDTVLFVGRLHPIKNLEALIDSWPSVVARHPGIKLIMAGAGEPAYERALRERAIGVGASASVSFAGFLSTPEVDIALSRAAVFVLPSHHENFGMAALEAIAAGVPVVFSPDVQLSDFVSEKELGVVAEASPARLADAIAGVLSNQELRDRVASSGNRIVSECYSVETIGAKLRTMYLAVLEHPRAGNPSGGGP